MPLNSFFNVPGASQIAVAGHILPDNVRFDPTHGNHFIVIPVADVDKTVLNAIRYAKLLSGNIFAVHILINPSSKDRIEGKWKTHVDIPLIILESHNGSIINPLAEYVHGMLRRHKQSIVTVVLPVIKTLKWWQRFLFNQTARVIERAFEGKDDIVTIRVPFSLTTDS